MSASLGQCVYGSKFSDLGLGSRSNCFEQPLKSQASSHVLASGWRQSLAAGICQCCLRNPWCLVGRGCGCSCCSLLPAESGLSRSALGLAVASRGDTGLQKGLDISSDDLKDMDIKLVGQRRRLLSALSELRKAEEVDARNHVGHEAGSANAGFRTFAEFWILLLEGLLSWRRTSKKASRNKPQSTVW